MSGKRDLRPPGMKTPANCGELTGVAMLFCQWDGEWAA
jgi:hypothetical protein